MTRSASPDLGGDLDYVVVDVFTDRPFLGNPLAVFLDGRGLSTAAMATIAREMNLSETVFFLPPETPGCVARIRIFTPAKELPFAGHPTIGAAYVVGTENLAGGERRFVLEENIGPVPLRCDPGERFMAWLTVPPIDFGPTYERVACARALGLIEDDLLGVLPQVVGAGVPAIFIALRDRAAVDAATLDDVAMRAVVAPSAALERFVFCPTPEGAYSRMFGPALGIAEDPATGGLTGPLAAYMMRNELISHAPETSFVSEQGVKMGRRSLLHVRIHGESGVDGIEVGGAVTPIARGTFRRPLDDGN